MASGLLSHTCSPTTVCLCHSRHVSIPDILGRSALTAAGTAFQLSAARLSDIFGRKAMLMTAILIFLLSSLACALSQTMTQLCVAVPSVRRAASIHLASNECYTDACSYLSS